MEVMEIVINIRDGRILRGDLQAVLSEVIMNSAVETNMKAAKVIKEDLTIIHPCQ